MPLCFRFRPSSAFSFASRCASSSAGVRPRPPSDSARGSTTGCNHEASWRCSGAMMAAKRMIPTTNRKPSLLSTQSGSVSGTSSCGAPPPPPSPSSSSSSSKPVCRRRLARASSLRMSSGSFSSSRHICVSRQSAVKPSRCSVANTSKSQSPSSMASWQAVRRTYVEHSIVTGSLATTGSGVSPSASMTQSSALGGGYFPFQSDL
mmetsp:Transcript_12845/g.38271  ORF Transcript_12845/g.38271 Transcript_12845/m.38271 type:complete len:205 (+) Transcript_12845:980-1594(+)